MQMALPFYSSMAHAFRFLHMYDVQLLVYIIYALFNFICETFLWQNLVRGE